MSELKQLVPPVPQRDYFIYSEEDCDSLFYGQKFFLNEGKSRNQFDKGLLLKVGVVVNYLFLSSFS